MKEKTNNYGETSQQQDEEVEILRGFAKEVKTGNPASPSAMELVKRWQTYHDRYHHGCDDQKLRSLSYRYFVEPHSHRMMNTYGDGTARFISEAIDAYLEQKGSSL